MNRTHPSPVKMIVLALCFCFGLWLCLVGRPAPIAAQSAPAANQPEELRGVWLTNIDSDVLFSQENLTRAITRLSQLHFNTIYPTVWNWGYTLYPSEVAKRTLGRALYPEPGLQGRDMLAEAVRYGHRQGLSVIPWFEFGFMAPADSELARRHPTWLTQRRNGTQMVKEGKDDRVWLNPFHPEVQQFILSLVQEIVTKYEVDGIQFDDHFGLPVELGYDPYTVQLYRKEHRGKNPPTNPRDPQWVRWRANKLTEFMAQVFSAVKTRRSNCLVALSPNSQDFSYKNYLQDWFTWERRGYVEELILQVYRDNLTSFVNELVRPEVALAKAHIPVAVGILAGLKNRSVPMERIQSQVQTAREKGFAGVSFFFYETLGERDAGFQALFPAPRDRPNILAGWRIDRRN